MATIDNLKAAFAGESQANRKYLAFAKKADADGLKQIAKLFRAAAEAETVHAHAHFRVMGGVGSTEENLNAAIAGERSLEVVDGGHVGISPRSGSSGPPCAFYHKLMSGGLSEAVARGRTAVLPFPPAQYSGGRAASSLAVNTGPSLQT